MTADDGGVVVRLDYTAPAPPKPTRIVKCQHCGGRRYAGPGVHGPRFGSGFATPTIIDCAGRPCRLGADGYWEVAP